MTSEPHNPQERSMPEDKGATSRLLWSMADTTWRMFTPPAIIVPLAIWADLSGGTKPWITLASVPAGLALSVLLIRQQLKEGRS
jgi:hypothetical protein